MLPVIPAGAGEVVTILTGIQVFEDMMPHELVAVTQILPPEVPDVTIILVLPWPEVMLHPVGTVQV
jgi:hypothetical protein